MQWVAFEPEHAQQFANGLFNPPPQASSAGSNEQETTIIRHNTARTATTIKQKPGYLHTYQSKRDLHLLYIDGMSGGKTLNGTLDSQDYILLNETNPPAFWEYGRGEGLCDIARNDWHGRVDGFLRMEAGFEVILCDFESSLSLKNMARSNGKCAGCTSPAAERRDLKYLRAVADRYRGIGGGKVRVNYEKMVSAYTLQIDLFVSGERGPRLKSVSAADLRTVKERIDEIVLTEPSPFTEVGMDWQAIVDLIVTRYSSRLKYLAMPGVIDDDVVLSSELNDMLSIFIDYDNRSFVDENLRCTSHLFPSTAYEMPQAFLAKSVVNRVINYICYSLISTQHGAISHSLSAKQNIINGMIEKLDWTTWKECGPCAVDEICSIPLWPFGSERDWIRPTCRNASTIHEQRGYWGPKRRVWD
jgi:hypothetical protein